MNEPSPAPHFTDEEQRPRERGRVPESHRGNPRQDAGPEQTIPDSQLSAPSAPPGWVKPNMADTAEALP